MAYQWERAVILRFGRFHALKGSGLFAILPVIDKVFGPDHPEVAEALSALAARKRAGEPVRFDLA